MIRVKRTTKPQILTDNEAVWLKNLLSAKTQADKDKAQEKYRHKQVKQTLSIMFHDKCAFCEAQIAHVSYPHIEHYRPKSKYKTKTFDWDNLLLACGVCNSAAYKGENFPLKQQGGLIINPCKDDPNIHFNFTFDQKSRLASVASTTTRGATTETLLGLNRYNLRVHRSTHVSKLMILAKYAKSDPEALLLFNEAKSDSSEYSAFAKTIAAKFGL